jgi:hypothetical protein
MGYHCDKAGRMNYSFTAIVFSHHTDSISIQSPNHFKHDHLASSDRQLSHSELTISQSEHAGSKEHGIFHEQYIRLIKYK